MKKCTVKRPVCQDIPGGQEVVYGKSGKTANEQGQKDSNLQRPILETGVLPFELYPLRVPAFRIYRRQDEKGV